MVKHPAVGLRAQRGPSNRGALLQGHPRAEALRRPPTCQSPQAGTPGCCAQSRQDRRQVPGTPAGRGRGRCAGLRLAGRGLRGTPGGGRGAGTPETRRGRSASSGRPQPVPRCPGSAPRLQAPPHTHHFPALGAGRLPGGLQRLQAEPPASPKRPPAAWSAGQEWRTPQNSAWPDCGARPVLAG